MSGFGRLGNAPVRADSGHRSHAPGSSHTASSCRPREPNPSRPTFRGRAGSDYHGGPMTTIATRIPVLLLAADPILRNGLRTTLHSRPEIRVVDEDDLSPDTVVIVATDRIDDQAKQTLRSLQCRRITKVVLIAGDLDDADVLAAVENGVCAVARRSEVDADILVRLSPAAVSGDGVLPPDLLGRLLGRVSRLQRQVLEPRGLHIAGFTDRETEVLRLLAAGLSTSEIARKLSYSQRTIKSIVHDVTNRFQLRNRSHAVAFAMREGLI